MTASRMSFATATGTTVLSVTAVETGPITVMHVAGDLDMDTAPQFSRHIGEVVAGYRPAVLIVDLGQLDFLGAAGVTALLACVDVVNRAGGQLRLRRPSHPARLALRATRTLDLFDVEDGPDLR
jgi:anti-sigma B factor antagonist